MPVVISLLSLFLLIVTGVLSFPATIVSIVPEYKLNEVARLSEVVAPEPAQLLGTSTLYILGDVMLGRHVEQLMLKHGSSYPYTQLDFLVAEPSYVLANFESALPRIHQKTPNFGMRFSVDPIHLSALRTSGVTHVGLANNHTFDYGADNFLHLQESLGAAGIAHFGQPHNVSSSSVMLLTLGTMRLALIAIMAIDENPDVTVVKQLVRESEKKSDIQIAYVHWGTEYEHEPQHLQQALARTLAESGVDLIIGHHPHVVQRIDMLGTVPVLYSLGNFIFDQYFSKAVQEGLVLKLKAVSTGLQVSLLPVTSIHTPVKPREMTTEEAEIFFNAMAEFSDMNTLSALRQGTLLIPSSLATSSEVAIMSR